MLNLIFIYKITIKFKKDEKKYIKLKIQIKCKKMTMKIKPK
jgi:hypothetical protein